MGYETRLIVGFMSSGQIMKGDHGRYVIKIADIDLCKSCFHSTIIDESDKANPVNTSLDGDSNCWKDLYGNELFGVDPVAVLHAMEKANKSLASEGGYRRYRAAIPMLESLIKDFEGQELTCILYGC